MPLPNYIPEPAKDGDDYKFPWTTRVAESTHQWLWDLQAEFGYDKKSHILRAVIFFAQEHLERIAEDEDKPISRRLAASANADRIIREFKTRQAKHRQVLELMEIAAIVDSKPDRIKFEKAAKELAKEFGIPFPPADMPLLARDKDAAHVLGKVQQVMTENSTSAIKLNELNPRVSKFNASQLKEILERLQEGEYLELEPAQTSGPETLWIRITTLSEAFSNY